MADTLIFPNISFDESDVGPRPTVAAAGNRIGVVGEFLRGPYNKFTLIDTPDSLMRTLGLSTHNGSLGIQTAMDQGARDFGVIRVMGSSTQAGAQLQLSLADGAKTTGSGRLMLFVTGINNMVIGNGAGKKEDVARELAAAINAASMPVSASVNGSTVTLTTSNGASQDLPFFFHAVQRDDSLAQVYDTGLLFTVDGTEYGMDDIIRLANGSAQIQIGYDLSAVSSTLSLTAGALVDNDTLEVTIGGLKKTLTVRKSPKVTISIGDFASMVAADTVSVKLDGVTQSVAKGALADAAAIFTEIKALFEAAKPASLKYVSLAVVGQDLVVSARDDVAFNAVSVTPSITGAATITPNVATSVNAKVSTATEMALNLAYLFAGHTQVTVAAVGTSLVIRPKKGQDDLNIDLAATASTAEITASWDKAKLAAPQGVVNSHRLHLMVGAEALATAGVSTAESLASELSKSVNDRSLSVSCNLTRNNRTELNLTSRTSGEAGNLCLYSVAMVLDGVLKPIDGLAVQGRAQTLGASYEALSNLAFSAFGGGVTGPKTASHVFKRQKFVRAEAAGTLSWVDDGNGKGHVKLTFTAGEASINSEDAYISLRGKSLEMAQNASISITIDSAENLRCKAPTADDEIAIGTYKVTGNQSADNLGTFEAAPAVNGNMLLVEAASEGLWGNDISVTPTWNADDGSIELTATYGNEGDENYVTESYTFKLTDEGTLDGSSPYPMVASTTNAALLRVYYVGDKAGMSAEVLGKTYSLAGGWETVAKLSDYISAINAMANQPVNILICPGRTEATIRDLLIKQANASDEISGMRVAVLSADRNTSPTTAKSVTNGLDSNYAVMVAGWATYTGRRDLAPKSVPPDGFYAGHMAVTRIEASMAARTTSPSFKGISATDVVAGSSAYDMYTRARLECIIQDQATGVFHCLNGRSLSTDPAWYWISLRRVYNHIRTSVFNALQFAKSEPNTPRLRRDVADTIDNLLFVMYSNGQIGGYRPTKADNENNPSNLVAQGLLRVDVYFTPIYPADFITVGIHRDVTVSVTVQSAK